MIALTGAILFSLRVILYIALLFGAPLGEYAMGGAHKILPHKNRVMIAISIPIQAFGIIVLLQKGGIISTGLPESLLTISCYIFAIYLTLNVFMNAFSRSSKERWVMMPLSAIVAGCYWVMALG